MAKEITHIIFADKMVEQLDLRQGALADRLKLHRSGLHFGAIAMDTWYYGVPLPFRPKGDTSFGELLHGAEGNDSSQPLLVMLQHLQRSVSEPEIGARLAFVCGLLSHVALDVAIHPFIYALSGNYHADSAEDRHRAQTCHRWLEGWLDLIILDRYALPPPPYPPLRAVIANPQANLRLLHLFHGAMEKVWELGPESWTLLQDCYRIQMTLNRLFPQQTSARLVAMLNRALNGKLSAISALFYPLPGSQCPTALRSGGSYRHPVTGATMSADLNGLWQNALRLAGGFMTAVEDFIFGGGDINLLKQQIPGYNLSLGMVGVPSSAACHFDPPVSPS